MWWTDGGEKDQPMTTKRPPGSDTPRGHHDRLGTVGRSRRATGFVNGRPTVAKKHSRWTVLKREQQHFDMDTRMTYSPPPNPTGNWAGLPIHNQLTGALKSAQAYTTGAIGPTQDGRLPTTSGRRPTMAAVGLIPTSELTSQIDWGSILIAHGHSGLYRGQLGKASEA
ncbi:hypothetical protein CROQUDRAFT_94055 [Cronartium quercuum f. sp. fusiforme G11]|uniref:Uncharacterized protein n=1 Tax=Cronartium quercuum f. sp. fusiforme G11 TaxID=708437 RepID=A0A9P6NFX6_9BASI|nr:hypothetical protein CROQUDRAFT_94055 [Cronartium quercuum f. sp. fusiforme G11]